MSFEDNPELAREAGRLGGEALKKKMEGSDYYSIIGKKGGDKILSRYGTDFFKQIGKKGGQSRGKAKKEVSDAEGEA